MTPTMLPRSSRRSVVAAFLLCAAIVPNAHSAGANAGEVVAKSGTVEFTRADLDAWLDSLGSETRQQLQAHPDLLEKALRNHLATLDVYADAQAKGWDKHPDVQAKITAATREVIYKSYLGDVSKPPADYPSAAEIQAVYDQHKDQFVIPKSYHVAQIFIAAGADADPQTAAAAGKKAADLAHRAQTKDADFAALARESSEDKATKAKGGDAGFVAETGLLPEVRRALAGMNKGDTSDPIHSTDGFHIIRLLDVKPAGMRTLAESSDAIRNALRQARQEELAKAYLDKLMASSPVTINGIALEKVGEGK